MIFPDGHPFKQFEKYYYLESGARNIKVYIFRFSEKRGVITWFVTHDGLKGPHGSIQRLKFTDDYLFDRTGKTKDIYCDSTEKVMEELATYMEVWKDEPIITRENS